MRSTKNWNKWLESRPSKFSLSLSFSFFSLSRWITNSISVRAWQYIKECKCQSEPDTWALSQDTNEKSCTIALRDRLARDKGHGKRHNFTFCRAEKRKKKVFKIDFLFDIALTPYHNRVIHTWRLLFFFYLMAAWRLFKWRRVFFLKRYVVDI